MPLLYAWERARVTLQRLAVADAPLPERLEDAYFQGVMRILPGQDLPTDLRARHAALSSRLKRRQGEPGSAAALVAELDEHEREQLAEELFEFCLSVAAALAQQAPEELR